MNDSVLVLGKPAAGRAAPVAHVRGRRTGAALRLLTFFAVVVGSLFAVHHLVNTGLRRIQTSSFGVANRIVDGQVNAKIVISGSSRALTHYDPRIVEAHTGLSCYNIGLNGSQTDMQVARLKTYLAHNARPALIVHNLDLFSFVTTKEIFDPAQYVPYLDEPAIYEGIARIYPDAWKWKFIPLYGYAAQDLRFTWLLGLQALVGIQPPQTHFNGFMPRHLAWTGDFEKLRAASPDGVTFAIEPAGVRDLEEIAELCAARKIPLIFAYSPVYYEMLSLERNRAEVFRRFQEIASRHGALLWDYSDSPICRQQDLFYNSQHLNAAGAAAFSTAFARQLVANRLPPLDAARSD